jgi:hypothetical protein
MEALNLGAGIGVFPLCVAVALHFALQLRCMQRAKLLWRVLHVASLYRGCTATRDATGYALSVNINRRHLSKGQRAMAVAKAYPEPEHGAPGKKSALKIKGVQVNEGTLSQARTVLRLAPSLADEVLAGNESLTDAYHKAGLLDGGARQYAAGKRWGVSGDYVQDAKWISKQGDRGTRDD